MGSVVSIVSKPLLHKRKIIFNVNEQNEKEAPGIRKQVLTNWDVPIISNNNNNKIETQPVNRDV